MSGYDKILKVYGLTDDIKTWAPETGFQDRKEPYFVTHGVNMMEVRLFGRVCVWVPWWWSLLPDGSNKKPPISSLGLPQRPLCLPACGVPQDLTSTHPPTHQSITPSSPPQTKVMACPDVDFTRTTCNDLIEIFEALGIEAARSGMLNEIRSVLFFDGGYINYRHMSILVDVMTFRGALTAVSRHGINRGEQVRLGGMQLNS